MPLAEVMRKTGLTRDEVRRALEVLCVAELRRLEAERLSERSRLKVERLAELRQEAWANLGRWFEAWPNDARLARALTKELNGHDRELDERGPKRGYFSDPGGVFGKARQADARFSPPIAPQARRDLDRLMRLRPHADTDADGQETAIGGRATRSGTADESKRFDLDSVAADMLGHDGDAYGNVMGSHHLAGGQHDLVWLEFERRRRYEIDEYRDVLTRRGHLPARLGFVKRDAERLIYELHALGLSKAQLARLFNCRAKTIGRNITRHLNVPLSPYGGEAISFPTAPEESMTTVPLSPTGDAVIARVDRAEARLAEALLDIQRTLNGLALRYRLPTESVDWLGTIEGHEQVDEAA